MSNEKCWTGDTRSNSLRIAAEVTRSRIKFNPSSETAALMLEVSLGRLKNAEFTNWRTLAERATSSVINREIVSSDTSGSFRSSISLVQVLGADGNDPIEFTTFFTASSEKAGVPVDLSMAHFRIRGSHGLIRN